MKLIFHVIAGILLYISVPAQTIHQGSVTGNVYALLVGISKYGDPDIPPLQYADRDATVFADFLQSKAGGSVPNSNIRLLTNSNASVAAVNMAIKWLVRTCKKGDLVFFYFSGHADLENITLRNSAYLICYNTPVESYENMSLSVDYLNDIANTLSAKTGANVVLITDACHSGKMADNKENALVGQQLMDTKEKEIRIASCEPDQLSNEKADWGGGRGVFSYYLVNGLKGLADQSNDGIVSFGEIRNYLQSSMANDPVLRQENKVQTPVLKGMDGFALAKVDTEELNKTRQQSETDSASLILAGASPVTTEDNMPSEPEDYFMALLKRESLEVLTDSLKLDKLPGVEIPFVLVRQIKENVKDEAGINKLDQLLNDLRNNAEALTRFKESMVIVFDDQVQEVINQYLKGDEAELERRRYYNVKSGGYDVYPKMLAVALQLTEPGSYFHNILEVKLHYFTGVVLRLKIPLTENPALLIDQALTEQQKAMQLEKNAAYIYNELGVLYDLKKKYSKAEKYYNEAINKKPEWALPRANLGGLYAATGKLEQGIATCKAADSLKTNVPLATVNMGFAYEKSGNLLFAEEYYRKAIDINSRHYLPFENLGYVYMNTTRYALADSFFYEASIRKKGYHFNGDNNRGGRDKEDLTPTYRYACMFKDPLKPDDMFGWFAMGMSAFFNLGTHPVDADGTVGEFGKNNKLALECFKKVVNLDKKNPLVYHYMGMLYYEQQQWEEAELMFRHARENYLNPQAFMNYVDSVSKSKVYPYDHYCYDSQFKNSYYRQSEELYFMASLYDKWRHPAEAESLYKKIIAGSSSELGAYIKLMQLLESQSLLAEAENILKSYPSYNNDTIYRELNAFYRRSLNKMPGNAEWSYRLGVLLYDHAGAPSLSLYRDTIIWFPKINKEVFLPGFTGEAGTGSNGRPVYALGAHEEEYNIEDLDFDTGPGTSDRFIKEEFDDNITNRNGYILRIPGTGEIMQLAKPVLNPRYDGIRYLKKAAELTGEPGTQASINYKIGDIYVWAGSKKQAYPYYKRSLELVPQNSNTRMNVMQVCVATYKNAEAMEHLGYLYKHKQMNFHDRLLYAGFNMYAGEFNRSQQILDEADAINPYPLPEIADLRARLYLLLNNSEKAIAFYKSLLVFNPNDAGTSYTLARLYAGKKNNKEAFRWLETALRQGFNYNFVLNNDPVMNGLSKTSRWSSLVNAVQSKNWNNRK